ncbi:reverse transcriptase N-terminal domain-containing protein [Clostridium estertheticum]|uniref:Reverse transcriptase N-terminal domain-containing protein n=1 Tax=Clostridium estertheticum TaxID=238834 RepID=A0AA47EMN7_9CLOT|nr:reverse transcriptase N-terminal domain-containing protein [Clostridium estertheticum]WAG61821.1 reverse transcriptase N-terminal domain-containing protein [Clostridium estertheticum]
MSNALAIKSTLPNVTSWKTIDWTSVSAYVGKLQQRIYHAESQGKNRKVRELQRLLVQSKAALLLSIRKVTQINKGKKTAGVDKFTALTDAERLKLYLHMKEYSISQHKPKPSYRIYVKKKNGKLRPLSIPIIKDRIWQNMTKLALEPQWEYIFEPTSYGFRPGRGCHDAIARIFTSLARKKKRWIFEGDFKGCFDNLRHDYIMEQIRYFPNKGIIEKWLKSGYIDNNVFNETDRGGGQGSIISPLLANIALHGMEECLGIKYTMRNVKGSKCASNITDYSMTRYADDCVPRKRGKQLVRVA